MDVSPTGASAATTTGTTTKPATGTATTANAMAGDFDTFLKLLTTQMKNQDPLQPMDSTAFVSQLASFSAVEQQIGSNTRLDKIVAALTGGSTDTLAQWIGKEVLAPGKGTFDGTPMSVDVTPVQGADSAQLVVTNDFGQVVAREKVDPKAATVTWNGTDDVGNSQAHGSYGFALESYQGSTLLGTQDGRIYSRVTEVRVADGTPSLVLEGGGSVTLDQVAGVR